MMFQFNVPTKRGSVLNGVLFHPEENRSANTVMIAITGIHGNFYSNPFYYNIGDTVNVLPPIEAGASCFNENSATDSKELRRLTLSPQA